MANDKDGLIIVPKPGQLLTELGATGALADAAKAASYDDFMQTKLRDGLLSGTTKVGFDWGASYASDITYREKTFKNEYFGTWPPEQEAKDKLYDGMAIPGGITKQALVDGAGKVSGIDWSNQAEIDAIAALDQQIALNDLARFPDIFGPPQQTLQQEPEDTPIEPDDTFQLARRRVRPVDTEEPQMT